MYLVFFSGWGYPGDSNSKESACNVGDLGLNPGLGRSPGEGNGSPLLENCLENSMDRGTGQATQSMDGGSWQATIHCVAEADLTEQLSLTQQTHLTI